MKSRPWPGAEAVDPASLELLARRAARLRAVPEHDSEERTVVLAGFSVGGEGYAIELGSLCAVVPLRQVTPVPLAPAQVLGIVRHQDEVVPVLSFASLLSCRWRKDPEVLLVVQVGSQRVGLDLEEVPREIEVPAGALAEARTRTGRGHLELSFEGRRLLLLDLALLLAPLEAGDGR